METITMGLGVYIGLDLLQCQMVGFYKVSSPLCVVCLCLHMGTITMGLDVYIGNWILFSVS